MPHSLNKQVVLLSNVIESSLIQIQSGSNFIDPISFKNYIVLSYNQILV